MSDAKSPDQLLLEKFLGTEFEFDPEFPAHKEARFFDGALFWQLWLDEEKRLLHLRADTEQRITPYPPSEVTLIYEKLGADSFAGGGGEVLQITPQIGEGEVAAGAFWLTKTPDGRFSLCISLGSLRE